MAADTPEIIGAAGTAITGIVVAGITAWKAGRRSERRQHRERTEPHQNGSVMSAAAEMLEGSTEALEFERAARNEVAKRWEQLVEKCAAQDAKIRDQARIIEDLTALIATLRQRIEVLEKSVKLPEVS